MVGAGELLVPGSPVVSFKRDVYRRVMKVRQRDHVAGGERT